MTQPTEEPQLVGDDWKPSTFDDPGAAELSARIEAAAPLVVPRRVLDGRCGLEARELWELGVRTVPAGALSTGGGVVLRLVMVAAIAAMGVCLGTAAVGVASLDDRDHGSLGVGGTIGLVMVLVFIAHGLFRLAWSAAGRERRRRLDRRRVAPEAVAPLLDPNGRLTVAVLDGPGVLRVLLLWLRGHPQDADMLEARVVAERRVPRDEPSRAEDAVAALSEVAMLATRERADQRDVEGADASDATVRALAVRAADASRLVAARPSAAATAARATASRVRVGPDWQPDGTTDDGEAELARRLLLAKPQRWSAELLAPLVVDDVREVLDPPAPLPSSTARERRPRRPVRVTAPALVLIALFMCFVVSAPTERLAVEVTMRGLFLALALWVAIKAFQPQIAELPHWWRRRGLVRRVDDAACDAAAGLESGLPGGHGALVVLSTEQNERHVVRLVHLRAIVDAPEGTLEARVLAERRLEPEDDAVETVGRFLLVADDQAFTTQRGRERIEGLQRLSRRLGVTSGQRGRRHALLREPLALLAVPGVMLSALLAVLAVVFAFTGDASALELIGAAAVMASVAAALLGCARRWTSLPG